MALAPPTGCFVTRIARISHHVDRGEWASSHALLNGLRQCSMRGGCLDGESCAFAADLMMGELAALVRRQEDGDQGVA